MAEEKILDMEGIAEDAAEAEKAAEDAKQEPEIWTYTHEFKKPFQWRGQTYERLTFDWTVLKGKDHLEIEQEILIKGRTLITPAFTGDFLAGMAARACMERNEKGKRVIDGRAIMEMEMVDFQAITRKARGFLPGQQHLLSRNHHMQYVGT